MAITNWADISNTFERGRDGDLLKSTDIGAVKNSVTNIFSTLQGDRRMLPDFAMAIHRILFEPMDRTTAKKLGNYILHGIEFWEPRIEVTNLNVHSDYDRNKYDVTLTFNVKEIDEVVTLDFAIKRG